MFKVICIDAKSTYKENEGKLTEGSIYTVISDSPIGYDGKEGYILAEVKNARWPEYGFAKPRFVPLGGPDERERLYDRQFAQILESNPDAI